MMIGPAMFYFFVCKTEVFKLVTRLMSDIKGSTTSQSTISSTKIFSSVPRFWRSGSYETSQSDITLPNSVLSDKKADSVKYQPKGEENSHFENDELPAQV